MKNFVKAVWSSKKVFLSNKLEKTMTLTIHTDITLSSMTQTKEKWFFLFLADLTFSSYGGATVFRFVTFAFLFRTKV